MTAPVVTGAPVDVLAVMESDARAARADRLAQARFSSHSAEESRRAQALWSRSIEAREAVQELIEQNKILTTALRAALPHVEHAYHTNPDPDGSFWIDVIGCRNALARVGGAK